jgi:hypothetical protein
LSVNGTVDYDSLRIALMNTYSNEALYHLGLIIPLILAVVSLFSSNTIHNYYKGGKYSRLLLYFLFSFLIGLIVYSGVKLFYWSWLTSESLIIPVEAVSVNSTRPIYEMGRWVVGEFNSTQILFLEHTFSGTSFTDWSYLCYFAFPFVLALIILWAFFDRVYYWKWIRNRWNIWMLKRRLASSCKKS